VNFICDRFERFSVRKFAITLLRKDSSWTPPHLFHTLLEDTRLYLRYCRADSDDWWKDRKNCDECIYRNRLTFIALSSYRQSENNCSCIKCKRQPPSLRDLNSDAYFRDIRDFDFNVNTTFNQYVNAVDSDLVHTNQVRPPGRQTIQVNFKFDNFQNRFHLNCPGEGSWHGQIYLRTFDWTDICSCRRKSKQYVSV